MDQRQKDIQTLYGFTNDKIEQESNQHSRDKSSDFSRPKSQNGRLVVKLKKRAESSIDCDGVNVNNGEHRTIKHGEEEDDDDEMVNI